MIFSEVPSSQAKQIPSIWDKIDAVLVINLDHRIERWEKLQLSTKDFIPPGKLQRIPAVLGSTLPGHGVAPWFRGSSREATWAARGGCVLAHRRALETARQNQWDCVLILEDDADFDADFQEHLDPLHAALFDSLQSWDICYLGFTNPQGPYRTLSHFTPNHHLSQVYGCKCTHAYLLQATLRDWLIDELPDESSIWRWLSLNRAIDRWYLGALGQRFRVLAVSPSLIVQENGFSDIVGRVTDHFGTDPHCLNIPAAPLQAGYTARYYLQIQVSQLGRFYNYLSALRKRLSGF
jgi:hypothetical protein